jgi:hypothetical protein
LATRRAESGGENNASGRQCFRGQTTAKKWVVSPFFISRQGLKLLSLARPYSISEFNRNKNPNKSILMSDPAMQFEYVVSYYLGNAVTSVYYATYFQFDFPRRALLFTICFRERHVNPKAYTKEELAYLSSVQDLIEESKETYGDLVVLVKFLDKKRNA